MRQNFSAGLRDLKLTLSATRSVPEGRPTSERPNQSRQRTGGRPYAAGNQSQPSRWDFNAFRSETDVETSAYSQLSLRDKSGDKNEAPVNRWTNSGARQMPRFTQPRAEADFRGARPASIRKWPNLGDASSSVSKGRNENSQALQRLEKSCLPKS